MDVDFTRKREHKGVIELQLTAMIDVFSMIVIFLIFGTVFGAADIVIPTGIEIPKSLSKEGIESAPRVVITKDQVFLSLMENKAFPLSDFHASSGKNAVKAGLKPVLDEYQAKLKNDKASVAPLNLLADFNTPYQDIFDVVVVFRELGFNTILFVANGVGGAGGGGASGGGGGGQ